MMADNVRNPHSPPHVLSGITYTQEAIVIYRKVSLGDSEQIYHHFKTEGGRKKTDTEMVDLILETLSQTAATPKENDRIKIIGIIHGEKLRTQMF